ncbi:hypothetical protein MRX96_007937 [Rhipicephalus microplus]
MDPFVASAEGGIAKKVSEYTKNPLQCDGALGAACVCTNVTRVPISIESDRGGLAWAYGGALPVGEKSGRRKTPIHKRAEWKRSKNGPGAGRSIEEGQEEEQVPSQDYRKDKKEICHQ